MNFFKSLAVRNAWVDTVVLVLLLATANWFLAPEDFGWRRLHPSPWLLLPVLVGCRYGFAAGIASGLAGSAFIWVTVASSGAQQPDFMRVYGFFLAGMILLGGICGEICAAFRKRELQLATQLEHAQQRLNRLDDDLFFLREAKSELERLLATKDAELATLDTEIRRLFESVGDELYQDILLLLSRQARVTDAAIYTFDTPVEMHRRAALGRAGALPERMGTDDIEMVMLALQARRPVSTPDFWQRPGGPPKEHLMAVPLMDSQAKPLGVLLVTGMPFLALSKKTVHLVALICRWASRVCEIRLQGDAVSRVVPGAENQRIFSREFFAENLRLSYDSYRQHRLPSAIALFLLPRQSKALQARFEQRVMANVRSGDFPADLGLPVPHLAVLLPLCGERGANIFIERILTGCRKDREIGEHVQTRLVTFDQVDDCEKMWEDLTSYVPARSGTG